MSHANEMWLKSHSTHDLWLQFVPNDTANIIHKKPFVKFFDLKIFKKINMTRVHSPLSC